MDDALTVRTDGAVHNPKVQPNVISTWQRIGSAHTQPVGIYSQCNMAVDGAGCWGLNPVVNDYDVDGTARTGTTLFGIEIDANVKNKTTAGASLFFGSDMFQQPVDLGVIHVPAPPGAGHFKYTYGLWIDDGAVNSVGLHLGALEGKVQQVSGSQMLEFMSHTPDGNRSTFLFTDSSNILHFRGQLTGARCRGSRDGRLRDHLFSAELHADTGFAAGQQ